MPRQSRLDAPGALHHIIFRGIERRNIFADDRDQCDFLDRLGAIVEEANTGCYAWTLIPDHFHLLLRTGSVPIATVMRRLLTGHAARYNRRHRRNGHLFQNRYKSILCQEDSYFLELVRYIHLNPLRAKLVEDMDSLGKYPFSGHSVIMGKILQSWQDIDKVLSHFGKHRGAARRSYRVFVSKGIEQGRRSDLTGGGLIRSQGGWATVKSLRKAGGHLKSDERILGDSDFVKKVLAQSEEALERKYALQAKGIGIEDIAKRVAQLLEMPYEAVWLPGKYQKQVAARSLLCFWAVNELGFSVTALGKKLGISAPAVSKLWRKPFYCSLAASHSNAPGVVCHATIFA